MDKAQIDFNVNQAIALLNIDGKRKSILPAIPYINKALELCEGSNNLAYFITIKNIVLGLKFYTKAKDGQVYLDFYKDLFNYLLPHFVKLESFQINEDDGDEALVVNDVCTTIINVQVNFFSTLIKLMSNMGLFALGKIKRAGKEHIVYHRVYCTTAYRVLEKYKVNNPTIRQNCLLFRKAASKEIM